ncbi:hypothetical protein ACHWQZ_G015509 [Mnemiopsis leidyi]
MPQKHNLYMRTIAMIRLYVTFLVLHTAICGTRTRSGDEAVPASIHLSKQEQSDKEASNAIDLNCNSKAMAGKNSDNEIWLKIKLDQVYCVKHVIEYNSDQTNQFKWTCSQDNCDLCGDGSHESACDQFSLTVYIESEGPSGDPSHDFPLEPNCRNGNAVKLERIDGARSSTITVAEIAVFGQIATGTKYSEWIEVPEDRTTLIEEIVEDRKFQIKTGKKIDDTNDIRWTMKGINRFSLTTVQLNAADCAGSGRVFSDEDRQQKGFFQKAGVLTFLKTNTQLQIWFDGVLEVTWIYEDDGETCSMKNALTGLMFKTSLENLDKVTTHYRYTLVPCTSLNSEWDNVETETSLPVEVGASVNFWCSKKYVNVGSRTGKCLDGQLQPETEPPRCLETGLIILANYTALDGIITIRSETVIREGLLEFIVEGGYGGDGREGDGMDVALIRVEFTSDAVILSSRYQKGFVGMQHLTLKPRNEMLNSSQILQFLGSDELLGGNIIRIFGNTLQKTIANFRVSQEFLRAMRDLRVQDIKIKKIYKTIGMLSVFNFCPTSYPRIVCKPKNSTNLNFDDSLVSDKDECTVKLMMSPAEERTLKCIGYGAPDMDSDWRSTSEHFKLVKTKPDLETMYEGNYALETSVLLNVSKNSGAGYTAEVICEIWNKNFEFPHRYREKRFLISVNPEDGKTGDLRTHSPTVKKQTSLALYIICVTAGSIFFTLFLLLATLLCRRHRMRHRRSSAPKIPQPPTPERFPKRTTSSCKGDGEKEEHVYDTIDEIPDPACYCYAWTVSTETLKRTRKPVEMVLGSTDMPEGCFQGPTQHSSAEPNSSLSQFSLGPNGQRTYSNTCFLHRQRQIHLCSRSDTEGAGLNSESEYVTKSVPIRPRSDRQSTRSQYVSLSPAKPSLDIPEYALKRGKTLVRRDTMNPIIKTTADLETIDVPSKYVF